ncbi:MAG: hypothetical protein AB7S44_03695 [Spirochaetales bacterium]
MEKINKILLDRLHRANETLFCQKEKKQIVNFISKNFLPTKETTINNKLDDRFFTFNLDGNIMNFVFNNCLKCWIVYANNKQIFNCYENPTNKYIDGYQEKTVRSTDYSGERAKPIQEAYALLFETIKDQYEYQKESGLIPTVKSKTDGHILVNKMEDYWTKRLTNKEKIEFFEAMKTQPEHKELNIDDFYKICKIFYVIHGKQDDYLFTKGTPKQCYLKNADGRHDELDTVVTHEDLINWVNKTGKYENRNNTGHPVEIAYSLAHLHIIFDKDGHNGLFDLITAPRYADSLVKTYVEARKQGLPLEIEHAKDYLEALKGNGKIEIHEHYSPYGYPDKEFLDNLGKDWLTPTEKRRVVWDQIELSQIKNPEKVVAQEDEPKI